MRDVEKIKMEREQAAVELTKIASAFEAGFKNVSHTPVELTGQYVPFEEAMPLVRTAEHRECWGDGGTVLEAINAWHAKLAQLPQTGDRLFWRVRPEIDWSYDFAKQAAVWKVYARLAIFETVKDAA